MYDYKLHKKIDFGLEKSSLQIKASDLSFYSRFIANISSIHSLFHELYSDHQNGNVLFDRLIDTLIKAYIHRSEQQHQIDNKKFEKGNWFLSNELGGMSLYVDRFCGNLKNLEAKLDYFKKTGINVLHLMPLFESPEGESDGGYAVSDFRKVAKRFGTLSDLKHLREKMSEENMYLLIDIVLNHTSHHHEWAEKAKSGDKKFQDFFYMYNDRNIPDQFEKAMPEIFPESAPGNFTYIMQKMGDDGFFISINVNLNLFSTPKFCVAMMDQYIFMPTLV